MSNRTFVSHGADAARSIQNQGAAAGPVNFRRRLLKLGEELGEATEVLLAMSGTNNYKNLGSTELREELADVYIVGADILFRYAATLPADIREELEATVLDATQGIAVRMSDRLKGTRLLELEEKLSGIYVNVGQSQALLRKLAVSPADAANQRRFRRTLVKVLQGALDAMYHILPGEEALSAPELEARILGEIDRKVSKWARVRQHATVAIA